MDVIKTKYPYTGAIESRQGGRPENQDDYGFVETPLGLLVVVCDGMGGGPGGKTASYLAKTAIIETVYGGDSNVSREEILTHAIENAQLAVSQKTQEYPELHGMGTTAVILLINEVSALICHVGDSRAYKVRSGRKVFRTNDHSMVGEMVRNGTLTEEQARLSAQSNIITQAIGSTAELKPEFDEVPYEKGDRFVLCTDGIWGTMPEGELVKKFGRKTQIPVLVESMAADIDSLGKNSGGHHDNLTLAIVETNADSKLKEKMSKKVKLIIMGLALLCVVSLIGNLVSCVNSGQREALKKQITNPETQVSSKDSIIEAQEESLKNERSKTAGVNFERQTAQSAIDAKDNQIQLLENQNKELKEKVENLQKQGSNVQATKPVSSPKPSSMSLQEKRAKLKTAQTALDTYRSHPSPPNKDKLLKALKGSEAITEVSNEIKKLQEEVKNSSKYKTKWKEQLEALNKKLQN